MKLHDFWFMSLETCLGMIMCCCCCCCVWCVVIIDFGTFHKNGFCVSFEEIKWFWWISWLLIMWNKLWIMYVWLDVCCLRVWIVFVRIGSKMGVEFGVPVKKMKNQKMLSCQAGTAVRLCGTTVRVCAVLCCVQFSGTTVPVWARPCQLPDFVKCDFYTIFKYPKHMNGSQTLKYDYVKCNETCNDV